GRSAADAEEITQEAFVTAIRQMHAFQGKSTLYSWVCGIAKNLARERGRFQERHARPGPAITAALDLIDEHPLADSIIDSAETHAMVGAALSELPPHYQRALVAK